MQKLILLLLLGIIPTSHAMEQNNSRPRTMSFGIMWLFSAEGEQKIIQMIDACDPDAPDAHGDLPVHKVAACGFFSSSKLKLQAHALAARTANINHRNESGDTPLHCLVRNSGAQQSDIQLLMNLGARWENTKAGYSPLLCILAHEYGSCVGEKMLKVLHLPHIRLADVKKALDDTKAGYSTYKQKISTLFNGIPLTEEESKQLPSMIDDFCALRVGLNCGARGDLRRILQDYDRVVPKNIPEIEKECRARYEVQDAAKRAVLLMDGNRNIMSNFKKNGRIIKAYYEAMRALGYVHPKKDEWQASKQAPFPIELAQKIAYYSAIKQNEAAEKEFKL